MVEAGLLASQFLKLRCRDHVSPEEERALNGACIGSRSYASGDIIAAAREPQTQSHLLIEGLVARHISLPDGRRQIVAVHVPGDFVDLHSFLLKELEHDVEALSPVTMALFPHVALKRLTETNPHLTRMLWLSTLLDASLHREWVLSVGRRTARERVAHFLCELHERLHVVGRTHDGSYALPMSQTDLADACGLTSVHVNRTLRELREDGLVAFRAGRVTIHDFDRLADVAEFDPFYLHQRREER